MSRRGWTIGRAAGDTTPKELAALPRRIPCQMIRLDAEVPVCLLSLTLFSCAVHAATPAVFRGDAAHTGIFAGAAPKNMKMKWRFKTRGKVRSSPAAADGIVCFGSEDGYLYALDAISGELVWKLQTNGDLSSSPAAADGVVYVVGGDGNLYAADLKTGKLKWRFQTGAALSYTLMPGEPRNWDFYTSSPNVANGAVFFGSGDGNIYAVNLDGKLRWKVPTKEAVRATPAIANGTVYAGGMDGILYALDPETGKTRWTFKTEGNAFFRRGEIQSSPAVADGTVFFGSRDGHLYAVDASTGQQKWRYSHQGSWVVTSPAVSNGVVYAGSSDGKFVNAVDAKTGAEKWRYKTEGRVFSSPMVADGRVYFGTWDGGLQSLNIENGKPVSNSFAELGTQSSATLAGGLIYFGSDDSCLYAVEETPVKERKEVAVDPALFDSYAGEYQVMEGMNAVIRRDAARLMLKFGDQPEAQLIPMSETAYFIKGADVEITFVKENGKVVRMILQQAGAEIPMKKLK